MRVFGSTTLALPIAAVGLLVEAAWALPAAGSPKAEACTGRDDGPQHETSAALFVRKLGSRVVPRRRLQARELIGFATKLDQEVGRPGRQAGFEACR